MLLVARDTLLYSRIPVPIESNLLLFPLAYVDTRYIPVVRAVIVVHTSVVGSWCRCVPLPVPRSTPALTVPRVAPTAGCLVPVGLPHAGRVASWGGVPAARVAATVAVVAIIAFTVPVVIAVAVVAPIPSTTIAVPSIAVRAPLEVSQTTRLVDSAIVCGLDTLYLMQVRRWWLSE